jgi:hypothetical protein
MNDTSPEMQERFREMAMSLSPSERMAMGCRMFDAAKALARAGIIAAGARTESEIRRQLFLRFYRNDFSEAECEKILAHLERVNASRDG